eukprot:1156900-Pelagomonas_calceolata.AAC.11
MIQHHPEVVFSGSGPREAALAAYLGVQRLRPPQSRLGAIQWLRPLRSRLGSKQDSELMLALVLRGKFGLSGAAVVVAGSLCILFQARIAIIL